MAFGWEEELSVLGTRSFETQISNKLFCLCLLGNVPGGCISEKSSGKHKLGVEATELGCFLGGFLINGSGAAKAEVCMLR